MPVLMTAPKVRTSKKLSHMNCRSLLASSSFLRIERLVRHEPSSLSRPDRDIGLAMLLVEDGAFLDIDRVAGVAALGDLGVVADLAFQTDVGDEALVRLGIEARQIAGVRVAIGIAVRDVEQENEIVAMGQAGSCRLLLRRGCDVAAGLVLAAIEFVALMVVADREERLASAR